MKHVFPRFRKPHTPGMLLESIERKEHTILPKIVYMFANVYALPATSPKSSQTDDSRSSSNKSRAVGKSVVGLVHGPELAV